MTCTIHAISLNFIRYFNFTENFCMFSEILVEFVSIICFLKFSKAVLVLKFDMLPAPMVYNCSILYIALALGECGYRGTGDQRPMFSLF